MLMVLLDWTDNAWDALTLADSTLRDVGCSPHFGLRVIYIFSFAAEAAPGAGIQNLLRYSASRHPSNKIAIRSYPDDECAGLEKIRLNLFYRPAVSGVEALWAL